MAIQFKTTQKSWVQKRRGQAVLEYFIIFAVLAAITLVGLTQFDDRIRTTMEGFFGAVAGTMTADSGPGSTEPTEPEVPPEPPERPEDLLP